MFYKHRNTDSEALLDLAEKIEYMTLSHCWGSWGAKANPVLTLSNLSSRQTDGIALSELPKTFRDAVEIASWFNSKPHPFPQPISPLPLFPH